jgi:hypothetical protein
LQYYVIPNIADAFAPDLAAKYGFGDGLVTPYPGFRGGFGYEWGRLQVGFETGYTYIKGDNPLVTDIKLV